MGGGSLKPVRRALRKVRRRLAPAMQEGGRAARYAVARILRPWSRAAYRECEAERKRRLMSDLKYLRGFLAERPGLQLQITSAGRIDGAGGQALAAISAMAFARNHQCRYLHTPFRTVEHAEGDAEAWTRRWEAFFSLGHGEARVPADAEIVPVREFVAACRRDSGYRPSSRLVVSSLSFSYSEIARGDTTRWLAPILRAKYLSNDKSAIPVFRPDGAVNVAVHVRRGDVGPDDPRYTPDAPVVATIAQVCSAIGSTGRRMAINLFSEGRSEQFAPYSAAGCNLYLNVSAFTTFHNLVAADLLVTTDSAFSHAAALISDGIVITAASRWGARERWLTRDADGPFNVARLAELLVSP